jgi:phytoene dehydrogenase-like protein
MANECDVVIVGGGHNGLAAAVILAKSGLSVRVLEGKSVIGGATRTEYPFKSAPKLGVSTGSYLLGLAQPEVLAALGVSLPTKRRDPHYFLPTTDGRYLLFGSDKEGMKRQFIQFFSEEDWRANDRLQTEVGQLREDIAPTWREEPLSIEATAEKYVRPALRKIFVDLVRRPVGEYLERFGFKSDLLKAMYAVTDGFSGLDGGYDTPGTGMNFLVHNMCRLPGSDGTWMIVEGGMGTVAKMLADEARKHGATIEADAEVKKISIEEGVARGVELADGRALRAKVVVCNADPFRMRSLAGADRFPTAWNARLDSMRRDGSTFKVNLCFSKLPKFSCLPEDRGQFGPTVHLLPDEKKVIAELRRAYAEVKEGKLPAFPSIEWYFHTPIDPSLRDDSGRHNGALFVQWVPFELKGTTWDAEREKYARHLLTICDRFAPGTSELVTEMMPLAPPDIESYFGITRGHIHHIDNGYGFADRLAYRTPVDGLYSCSAATHPAGSVIGSCGYIAAKRVLADLGRA